MCIHPSYVYVDRGDHTEKVNVPCKRCWRCRSNRVNDYVGRSLCESATSDWTCIVTLTYADPTPETKDQYAHKIVTPPHFQKWVKRLRKGRHKKQSIRYLGCGEYGERTDRAHFHAILFGKGPRLPLEENRTTHGMSWPHGHIFGHYSTDEAAARYVCKYLQKGEPGEYWFTLSKKPTLGNLWFNLKAQRAIETGVMPRSFEYLPPGGQNGRPYLVTGATRRDYLATILAGIEMTRPNIRESLSEWVAYAAEKLDGQAFDAYKDTESEEVILRDLQARVDARRPNEKSVQSMLLALDHEEQLVYQEEAELYRLLHHQYRERLAYVADNPPPPRPPRDKPDQYGCSPSGVYIA